MGTVTVRADHKVYEKTNDKGEKSVSQEALIRYGRDNAGPIRVWPQDKKPYAPGEYDLDPSSLRMVKDAKGYSVLGYPFPSLIPAKA